jgi:hypothetical protein
MNVNLYTWYGQRELNFCPKHFIPTKTAIDDERKLWILEKLSGRFFIGTQYKSGNLSDLLNGYSSYPYFEDPAEAVHYELTWS